MIFHLALTAAISTSAFFAPPEAPSDPEPIAVPVSAPDTAPDVAPSPEPHSPPDPSARPSEGVYAVGSSGVAPLPPAPEPVSPSKIPRGSWRGDGWLTVRLNVTGPIQGAPPGRATVIALGGGAEGGWRIRQWVGIGAAFSRQPHEVANVPILGAPGTFRRNGYLTAWDVAFLRLYAPVRGRVDPFIDVGGGVVFYDPARERSTLVGGGLRASVGLEIWVARQVTLGLSGVYRANFVDDTIGHGWQAALDFGLHW